MRRLAQAAVLGLTLVLAACRGGDASGAVASNPALAPPAEAAISPAPPVALRRDLRTVAVDAGHGGEDIGAVGVSGVSEKDITLAAALQVARALERRGYTVVLTRSVDETTPLPTRTARANASGAGLLVSVHANAAENETARGIETYSMDLASDESAMRLAERENRIAEVMDAAGAPPPQPVEQLADELRHGANAVWGRALAVDVHTALIERLRGLYGEEVIVDRRRRAAPFWVLLDAEIPGVLVELGYLTEPSEEQRVRSHAYQQEAAEAIADGINRFVLRAEAAEAGRPPG